MVVADSIPPPKLLPAPAPETKKRGRPKKEEGKPAEEGKAEASNVVELPLFHKARTWTEAEAESRRYEVSEMLEGYFGDMDRILSVISGSPKIVWSNMSPDELKLLVDFALLRAQHSKEAARTLEVAIEYRMYVGVAAIVLPRSWETALISIEAIVQQMKSSQQKSRKNRRVVDAAAF